MNNPRLTVIIPTRERADTLAYAIRTCVTQKYDNLAILVSDNYSTDSTREVVESFNDPRIKYVNTGKRLSMSDNYEFGISHVSEGYVSILGDDDGLLPDALTQIAELVKITGFDAINWKSDQYLWPSFRFNKRANLLKISLNDKVLELNGPTELQKLIRCENGYEIVPWLYKGFVSVNSINKVKKISGRFFRSMIPDVYSGIALANVIDRYIYSYRPFSLDAISNHSNGASYNMETTDKTAANMFLSEENIPMHKGFLYSQSAYMLTAESVFQAIDHKVLHPEKYDIDLIDFFEASLEEVQREPVSRYKNVLDAICYSATYFNISPDRISKLIDRHPNKPFEEKYNNNIEGYNIFKKRIEINADKYGVTNVYDASLLHQEIRNNPSKYISLPAKALSTAKFVLREVQKRHM